MVKGIKNYNMKTTVVIALLFISYSLFSQLDYEKFKGKQGKITFNKEYTYANLYDYKTNASKEDSIITSFLSTTIPEGLLTNNYSTELSNNKKDSVVFEIILYSKLVVDINMERICLIKYKTQLENRKSKDKLLKAAKTGDSWTLLSTSNTEIKLLEQIVLKTSVNMLFQFYNYRDDPNYEEINRLKPEIKDDKGVINIKKLAEVISKNRAVLQKYMDE